MEFKEYIPRNEVVKKENEKKTSMLKNKISVSEITSRITLENTDEIVIEKEKTEDENSSIDKARYNSNNNISIYVDLPKFMQKKVITPKEKGTLIHSIFENLPILTREEKE